MTTKKLGIAFLSTVLFLMFFTLTGNAQTLYSCESPRSGPNPFLHTIDPNTGATLTTTPITLDGVQLRGCNGLARHPMTGVCYIMLSPPGSGGTGSGGGNRLLATIDENTGVATLIGNTGQAIAGIAFDTFGGTLYGISGDMDVTVTPNLFIISQITGFAAFFQALVDLDFGETIGFNPVDRLIYRSSGESNPNVLQIFESINPNNMAVSPINISGDLADYGEQLALTHQSGNVLLTSQRSPNALHSITTGGVVSFIGNMDHSAKGLAFDCGIPDIQPIPTLSEWGLIAMAGVLGIIGLLALRREKAVVRV